MRKPNTRSRPRSPGSTYARPGPLRSGPKLSSLRALLPRPALVGRIGRRWRHGLAVVAALALSVGGAATLAAMPASAASGCSVAYTIQSNWGAGFVANLVVTNSGTTAITGWTVTLTYTGDQTLSSGWSGTWSQSGKVVSVTNASFNGSLNPGANTQLGAQFSSASGAGAGTTPTITCTPAGGTPPPPTPTINAAPASLSVAQGGTGTFTLALSAAPTSNETVSIAASGNTGLTETPATLTFTPSNFATPQTVTVTANATGTGTTTFTASGTGYTSATVTATEVPVTTPSILASPSTMNVTQGKTGTFTLALSAAPAANETVTVAATGNTGLTAAPTTLTFTTANFATPQTVTVTANATGTGATTFTASGTGYMSASVSATEVPANSGGGTSPVVSITSPIPGTIITPGSTVTLTAVPVAQSGSVTSVSFFQSTTAANNTLIGVASSSPFSFNWANVPAGNYSITAVATNGTESITSYPVALTVEPATVVTNPTSITVAQGGTQSFGVALSSPPTASTTVSLATSGDADETVSPATLTFTTANWNTPQVVTVASGSTASLGGTAGTITASATGYANGTVTATEALPAGSQSTYDQWFLNLYDKIMNPNNGYFSPKGIPYHSVETLLVEAPDYGHETTSETYSYYIWLTADYGRVTGNWTPFNNAWTSMQNNMIPSATQQPGQSTYNASSPAQYGPEEALPSNYPVNLNSSVPVGSDPLAAELSSTYGTSNMYAPMWIMDTDNRYGFGQCEDGSSTPSFINTYQRGPMESVWDTIPQPDCDMLKFGGPNGFLDLFNNGGGSFSSQYKFTDAPDADARMIQDAFAADTAAKAQGKSAAIAGTLALASKLGDYLRYSMFDKYFKQISATCSANGSTACPAGTSKANEDTFLLSWFFAWGGSTSGSFAWRISGTTIHEGYQNPVAAFALSTDTNLIPKSPTAQADWATSLTTTLNMFQWLQSSNGAIAGGFTNNWGGNYGDAGKPPAGDVTFDGMYYTPSPEYMNPPSNQWFGFQTWPMERVAEYYFDTGNAQAKAILDKWVPWAEANTSFNTTTGAICLPGTLNWSGQPAESWTTGTSNTAQPPANPNLTVTITGGCSGDIGVSGSLAKIFTYYAAKSGNTTAETDAQNILDVIHKFYGDSLGFSAPETRTDYANFNLPYDNTKVEGAFFPASFNGKYPGNIPLNASTNTFLSIRPWYIGDPQWSKVQAFLNGGAAPTFNYHRFWGEVDIASAFDAFAQAFPTVAAPAGF